MGRFDKKPLQMVEAISSLFSNPDNGIDIWTINPGNDDIETDKPTIIESHSSLWDLKRIRESGMLDRNLILATYLKEIDINKPYFPASYFRQKPMICTEISIVDWNKREAVNQCFEASLLATEIIHAQKNLATADGICQVRQIYVEKQEYLGAERYSEMGYYAFYRNVYDIDFIN